MSFSIIPAHELSLANQAQIFNAAFAGYVGGTFDLDPARFASFVSIQGIDLVYSRFARNETGELVSFGYINRTANVCRLAAMGTLASVRRSGAARCLVLSLIEEAQNRGDKTMVLEVIEQNPGAVALYRSAGFESLGRLFGWRSSGVRKTRGRCRIRELPPLDAMKLPGSIDYPDLPWAISRHAISKAAAIRAFARGRVAVIIGDPAVSPVRLYGFMGFTGSNSQSLAELTAALLAKFPDREFYAPPVMPEQFARDIFQALEFRKEQLNQFLMRKDL